MTIGKIRCKMNINSVKDYGGAVRVEMGAVYSSRPDSENKSFATATPSAFFSMDIAKAAPAASAPWLQPGAQVYVDLQLADIPEWNWIGDRYPEAGRKVEIRIESGPEAGQTVTGIFERKVDPEFFGDRTTYQFPRITLDDEKFYRLYHNTNNLYEYYWKYVE